MRNREGSRVATRSLFRFQVTIRDPIELTHSRRISKKWEDCMVTTCPRGVNTRRTAKRTLDDVVSFPRDGPYRTPARTQAVTLSLESTYVFRACSLSLSLSLSLSPLVYLSLPLFLLFYSLSFSLSLSLSLFYPLSLSLSLSFSFFTEDFLRERGFSSGLRDVSHCSSFRRNFCAKPGPSLTLYLSLSLSYSPALTLPLARALSFSVLGKRREVEPDGRQEVAAVMVVVVVESCW